MKTQKCERCHEGKSIVLFRGTSKFIMPWCRECRALDPRGAKLVNDRLRQARLSEEALKRKNEKRNQRAREIRQELRKAEEIAKELALAALNSIDLSGYPPREQKAIAHELKCIKDVIRAMR
jgi:hypothetical protein